MTNGSKAAAATTAAAVAAVANASVATAAPGPPPCSLWPFALAAPSTPALALTAHETSLGGPHWASRWDDARRLDVGAVAAAAAAVARAAAAAAGAPDAAANITAASVRPRVEELLACVAWKTPGLGECRLARSLLGARGARAAGAADTGPHHAGPLFSITSDPQNPDPAAKSPYARFLWEFLARATAESPPPPRPPRGAPRCASGRDCAAATPVCVGAAAAGKGTCVATSVAYVAAYPLELSCSGGCDGTASAPGAAWTPAPPDAAAAAWRANATRLPPGAVWAESNWGVGLPRLDLYQREGRRTGVVAFTLAAAATAAAGGAAACVRAAAARRTADPVWW